MKTIKTLVEIPAKYKYQAQDESGLYCAWESKGGLTPVKYGNKNKGIWVNNGDYGFIVIGQGNPNPDWRESLKPIFEYEEIER